jgi:DeoR family transcriptional regulator, fructose operon transcriptional repressor
MYTIAKFIIRKCFKTNTYTMITEERRAIILRKIIENHYVQVSNLAEEFEVTQVTIRRDLDAMAKEGLCIRKHGGAIPIKTGVSLELPYNIKRHEMIEEKEKIAKHAVDLIDNGDTIILDSGSTAYALATLLNGKSRITVVTNDLKIAVKLAESPKIQLICTGGVARSSVYSLEGTLTEETLKKIRVDKTFLGADAIHKNGTISNVNIQEVDIKKAMIQAADQIILLADSSKFDKKGFFRICGLSDVDILITDKGVSKDTWEMINSYPLESFFL